MNGLWFFLTFLVGRQLAIQQYLQQYRLFLVFWDLFLLYRLELSVELWRYGTTNTFLGDMCPMPDISRFYVVRSICIIT